MFLAVQGQHGTPDITGAVTYPHQLRFFTGLTDFCKCTDFPAVYSTFEGPCPQPESRVLICMLGATQDTGLMTIADQPHQLVKALIDCIIGNFHPTFFIVPLSYTLTRPYAHVSGRLLAQRCLFRQSLGLDQCPSANTRVDGEELSCLEYNRVRSVLFHIQCMLTSHP
jgi:hypothetical protein